MRSHRAASNFTYGTSGSRSCSRAFVCRRIVPAGTGAAPMCWPRRPVRRSTSCGLFFCVAEFPDVVLDSMLPPHGYAGVLLAIPKRRTRPGGGSLGSGQGGSVRRDLPAVFGSVCAGIGYGRTGRDGAPSLTSTIVVSYHSTAIRYSLMGPGWLCVIVKTLGILL